MGLLDARRLTRLGCAALLGAWVGSLGAQESPLVSTSSTYDASYAAENVLDGDLQTRWASQPSGGRSEWVQIDFGKPIECSEMMVHWEVAHATDYGIQVSSDGRTWNTAHRQLGSKGGKEHLTGLHVAGRYLRVTAVKPGGHYTHYSIWELEFPEPHMRAAVQEARRAASAARDLQARAAVDRLLARGVGHVVFATRRVVPEHWYANFGYYAAEVDKPYFGTESVYRDGAKLYSLALVDRKLTVLLDDPKGGIRDPQIHYSGAKLVFSYRPAGTKYFHLYEMRVDGTGLRQLSDGPYDDIEPSYLPDGGIVFVSSRCKRWVNCWTTQVATLHRCEADGSQIRPLSSNNEHDNTPWPLPDGRILYTRWEYVDRSQVHYHHLWTANPDGTGQTVFFGNLQPGVVMIDAKPIPGTDQVVASFSPGHGMEEHRGQIALVSPEAGPDNPGFAKVITPQAIYRDPWAFDTETFLAAAGEAVVLVTANGGRYDLCRLPETDVRAGLQTHEPRPVTTRPREALVQARTRAGEASGRFFLANVNEGRNMHGVKPGEIKRLLVLESLPKPINFTGGMEPLSYGGTFTLERILGTVPVERDGSAYFDAPALRSLVFVALDANGLAVKRMQSFTTVMPGETLGCTGCHEHRAKSPPAEGMGLTLAAGRGASNIEPVANVPDVIDFPRDIQPIFNRHCLKCHDSDVQEGGMVLSGDRGPHYSLSYFALTAKNQVADGRNRPQSNYRPRELGSSASPLLGKLEPEHHDVRVSAWEKQLVRLWIEIGAPYPGTYAGLGSGMIGGYAQNNLDRTAEKWPATQAAMAALKIRCVSCHRGARPLPLSVCDEIVAPPWEDMRPDDPRRRYSRHLLYNLTCPEKSLLLLAPLARAAGGLGLCRTLAGNVVQTNSPTPVFTTTADPDYEKILAAVRAAKAELDRIKRFDMPGFVPRPEWVREMRRFGILPAEGSDSKPIDVYATERRYWESLWHKPAPGSELTAIQSR